MSKIAFSGLTCFTLKTDVARSEKSESLKYLLLESNKAPSYYAKQNFPPNNNYVKDHHLFLLLKHSVNCFQDIVQRHAARINEQFDMNLHVSPGQIHFHGKDYQGIRINTKNFSYIPELIKDLNNLDIEFLPDNKKIGPDTCLLNFKKYIEFEEMQADVFKDLETKGRYFFRIPRPLEFEEFSQKIVGIKNNCDFHLFDSFLAHLFIKGRVHDFVGIYSEHCDESRFGEFKENLLKIFN